MTLEPSFFLTLLGWLVGAVVLYLVIRLAVTHAIIATRPQPGEATPEAGPPHLDADGL